MASTRHPGGNGLRRRSDAPADLVAAAKAAAERAYAPYSGFKVGCALRDASGRIYIGVNVENGSFPLGICAERVALLAWRDQGEGAVEQVVVFTPTDRPTPPCGLCRDALLRLAPAASIWLAGVRSVRGPRSPGEWLPAPSPGDPA